MGRCFADRTKTPGRRSDHWGSGPTNMSVISGQSYQWFSLWFARSKLLVISWCMWSTLFYSFRAPFPHYWLSAVFHSIWTGRTSACILNWLLGHELWEGRVHVARQMSAIGDLIRRLRHRPPSLINILSRALRLLHIVVAHVRSFSSLFQSHYKRKNLKDRLYIRIEQEGVSGEEWEQAIA